MTTTVRLKREGRKDDPVPRFQLHVPSAIARQAVLTPGMRFTVEVTDEGILYRPVDPEPVPDPRPAWRR